MRRLEVPSGEREGGREGEEEEAERPFRKPRRSSRGLRVTPSRKGRDGARASVGRALCGRRVRGFESRLAASEAGLGKRRETGFFSPAISRSFLPWSSFPGWENETDVH